MGNNIETMYNAIHYKLKVMNVEDDILKASSIINNRYEYPSKEKTVG